MKKSNKKYLFVFIIIIVFSVAVFILYGFDSSKNKKMDPTIIIDNDAIFKFNGVRWVELNDNEIDSLSWKKYKVYTDSAYFGKYYLVNQNKWYLFDDNNNAVNYEGSFIALDNSHKYKVINIKQNDITDTSYVEKVLTENNINTDISISSSSVIAVDIDNDGKNEYIYTISNRFSEKKKEEKYFGFIFMVKNNKVYYIYSNSSKEDDIYDGCMPYVNSIIDVDNNNKYEYIISCAYYSNNGVEQGLYNFDNANFNLLVSNFE